VRECLGLSVGATNLVAARIDGTATVRPASVPWRGSALTGFVERVGDPVPIVAPDGSTHDADRLMVAALSDLIRTAGRPGEPCGVALPAHWRGHVVARMRALLPGIVVSSDAVAALTALRAHPGLPARGVIVLCDFGATGTSVTLADASDLRTIGATVRLDDFSGEAIDQSVLAYLLAGLDVDASSTSAVASLTEFRANCRMAKERLSFQTATGLAGPHPGATVRLTRAELESLVRGPLDVVLAEVDDLLVRNGIHRSDLVAVASVGGGSRIPVVTQRLSEALRVPVTTTPQAQSVAAIGAALIAGREPEMVTRVAMAPRLASLPSVEPQLLAWSAADVAEPVEYSGLAEVADWARPDVSFVDGEPEVVGDLEPLAWYRRPAVLFAGAACAAVLAAAGLVATTDVDTVGTASAASVVSAVPSEPEPSGPVASELGAAPVEAAPEAAAPGTATVVVTPPPTIVRYTQAPDAQAPAPRAPLQTVTATVPTTTTTTPTTSAPTTTTPTTTAPTTTAPTTTAPTTTEPTTTTPTTRVPPTSTVSPTIAPPPSTPPPSTAPATETVLPAEPSRPVTAGDTASASR
jgi:hypothetical protein